MADHRNDKAHPALRRARKPVQATLHGPAVRRDRFGRCEVLESTGAGGPTDSTALGMEKGQAWSVNPYLGCQHACRYCYVPDTLHAERGRWGRYVVVKRDLPTRLAKAVAKGPRRTVYLSTSTDPYQPAEREHQITRRCLQVLARHDWPVEVLTRSPLVLRDLDLLTQFSQIRVGMSVPMLDDRLRKVLEPDAPPIAARLRALRRLAAAGLPTFANHTPACPPTTHDADAVADAFLDAGAQWVNSTRWTRRSTTLGPVWESLRGGEWEWITRFFSSSSRQEAWHQELGGSFGRLGLPLGRSFFNPPFEWMAPTPRARTRATQLDAPWPLRQEQPMLLPQFRHL